MGISLLLLSPYEAMRVRSTVPLQRMSCSRGSAKARGNAAIRDDTPAVRLQLPAA